MTVASASQTAGTLRVFSDYRVRTPLQYFQTGPSGKPIFVPSLLAGELWEEGRLFIGEGGAMYRYDDGLYVRGGDEWVRNEVRIRLEDEYRDSRSREVLSWCRAHPTAVPHDRELDTINVANGLLDWRAGILRPHSPDLVTTVRIPVQWDPGARCSLIDAFLAEAVTPAVVPFFEEIVGLLLIPETRYRKAVLFTGPTGTGKSTALTVIRNLLGQANVSAIGLQALSDDRFKVAELHGKLANICADIDYRASKSSGTFKQITGGTDLITGERKYQSPFAFLPTARLLFSANEPPASADQSDAYFARWLVVPFDHVPDTRDLFLDAKLSDPSELSGLLVKAVAGLQRLQARGAFDIPTAASNALRNYRAAVDSIAAFFAEECLVGPRRQMRCSAVYAAYQAWCASHGERYPQRDQVLISRLKELAPDAVVKKSNGYNTWHGLTATVQVSSW